MIRYSPLLLALVCLFARPVVSLAAADNTDILRLVPEQANLVLKIDHPRKLVETITSLNAYKQAMMLGPVKAALDTPQFRGFYELVAYYEHDLGAPWPDLLDQLAGGGIVVGVQVKSGNDDPLLVAVQAKDAVVLAKFFDRASELALQDAPSNEIKDQPKREKYKDVEIVHVRKDSHACRIGSTLLFANRFEAIKAGIDQAMKGPKTENSASMKGMEQAGKILPPSPLISLWYGLDYLKGRPEVKDILTTPRNNVILTFAVAGLLDIIRRADFVAMGLYGNADGLSLSVRMPAGRDGMAADVDLHLPRDAKVTGALPLLEPKGMLFSHSFYFDLGAFWTKRNEIMNKSNAKDFEKGVKEASRFLPGSSVDKLLTESGVYHRLVVASANKQAYAIEPKLKLPSFAYVGSSRSSEFGKSIQAMVRAGALLASTQVTLKLFEETYGDVTLFGYRFAEDSKLANDPQNLRFNFTPTFAAVNDQIIAASSVELCKELIDLVRKEDRTRFLSANMLMRIDARGAAEFLNSSSDGLLTQMILGQAIPEKAARQQVAAIIKYIQNLGTVSVKTDYAAKEFHFDIDWKQNK